MAPNNVTYWLTGLSGAGKSTLAQAVAPHLRERGQAVRARPARCAMRMATIQPAIFATSTFTTLARVFCQIGLQPPSIKRKPL